MISIHFGPVYPRVCGGTLPVSLESPPAEGLSPRVRGNLPDRASGPAFSGSIPACAGEPPEPSFRHRWKRVYPRVCGGTMWRLRPWLQARGLSPRVRGNRAVGGFGDHDGGSIPACAGEPRNAAVASSDDGVYPRVCGGTSSGVCGVCVGSGLSPRVRGNLHIVEPASHLEGSIPACAGEPYERHYLDRPAKVYPRVCGGTCSSDGSRSSRRGLSPRVRGNRFRPRSALGSRGSIPACAGEP